MHELAIVSSVVDMVVERTAGRRVAIVRLQVGRLSGVVPEAMKFCWELSTAGTPLSDARLLIDETPGTGHCRSCGADFALPDLILLCPCGSADVALRTGRELQVTSVEMVSEACA